MKLLELIEGLLCPRDTCLTTLVANRLINLTADTLNPETSGLGSAWQLSKKPLVPVRSLVFPSPN